MIRSLMAAVLVVFAVAAGRVAAQDTLRLRNPKTGKVEEVRAVVFDESPAAVRYRAGARDAEEVSAADVLQISYQAPPGVNALDWRAPSGREDRALAEKDPVRRAALLREALESYKALLPRVAGSKVHRRHVAYRVASVQALLAENDPRQIDEAIDALARFKTDHGDGWQLVPAVKALARLHELKGDAAGAQAAYEDLAANTALPPGARREFSLLVVRYLLRTGKHAEAARKARDVQSALPAGDPLAPKVQAYLAACDTAAGRLDGVEPRLRSVIAAPGGDDVKALARNTLGDYYRAKGRPEDAFWEYLWVDVHYNQDREESAKALYHLAKLFADARKDPARARECLDRLRDEKEFGGLDFHKKALAERPAPGGG